MNFLKKSRPLIKRSRDKIKRCFIVDKRDLKSLQSYLCISFKLVDLVHTKIIQCLIADFNHQKFMLVFFLKIEIVQNPSKINTVLYCTANFIKKYTTNFIFFGPFLENEMFIIFVH
ncbi:hypothetical protein BpHYR1_031797 [Brachionus plicatilis]|uniref:Uncharacterized protein n=1 Tax=Brachionus plicatilis TaxID=10195 RepID=A0A3M7QS90_BRAPC|nr:hypothetical protein BpHYR1_031797 [Brachionus plicatilis]